ncbi:MAG: Gfo/Idh/MocA family oxidoreductase [Armatimonadetes bacterium]|nr:Gfo/Idh/MocA family oxidoreductase [Armatimonadota bacterium]MDE2207549.1 Gfo/Idh/MocA family oxidoreductase [Armatimonadota bacterium]
MPTTRRRFLEESLISAAAAVVAARDADGGIPNRRVAPNDRVRIAVAGIHGRGKDHIRAWCRPGVEITAICDVDTALIPAAQDLAVKGGQRRPKAYQDIRRLLDHHVCDAISIATPNHWHALAGVWAMQAGLDVYVEKPVSHEVTEGRRLVEAARKYMRICQAGTQIRSSAGSRAAIDFIHSGGIGKVYLARGLCYKRRTSIGIYPDSPPPPELDYDIWLGPAPERPFNRNRFLYNWHWWWDYGNGDMGNQGIHQMDVARWALNQAGLPHSVMALGGRFGYTDAGETPNTLLSFFDYGAAHLIFEVRGLPTADLLGVRIGDIVYGDKGYVAFTSYDDAVAVDMAGNTIRHFHGGGDHFGNFLKAVRSRRWQDLHADILQGHISSALVHIANISYRLGKTTPFSQKSAAFGDDKDAYATFAAFEKHLADDGVSLADSAYLLGPKLPFDPRHERFEAHGAGAERAGDPDWRNMAAQANSMLTRKYRAPFVVPEKV